MKNEKLTEAARLIRQWCAARHDCHGCPFATDELECKIDGIPQLWGDETSDAPTEAPTATLDTPTATLDAPTRAKILDTAKSIITGEREKQYGHPEDNFKVIARFWEAYLSERCVGNDGVTINPEDVAIMMTFLKIARIMSGNYKEDSFIDACGYLALAGEIAGR